MPSAGVRQWPGCAAMTSRRVGVGVDQRQVPQAPEGRLADAPPSRGGFDGDPGRPASAMAASSSSSGTTRLTRPMRSGLVGVDQLAGQQHLHRRAWARRCGSAPPSAWCRTARCSPRAWRSGPTPPRPRGRRSPPAGSRPRWPRRGPGRSPAGGSRVIATITLGALGEQAPRGTPGRGGRAISRRSWPALNAGPTPREHHDVDGRVAPDLVQLLGSAASMAERQGVAGLRPVQGERGDVAVVVAAAPVGPSSTRSSSIGATVPRPRPVRASAGRDGVARLAAAERAREMARSRASDWRLGQHDAAVDHDRLAGDVGRGVAGEEGDHLGHLVGGAEPAERRAGLGGGRATRRWPRSIVGQRGVDHPGGDRVDPDGRRQLQRGALGERRSRRPWPPSTGPRRGSGGCR